MLKQDITYEDFDGNTVTETLHFNVTKTELTDNLQLQDELEAIQKDLFADGPAELSPTDIQLILNVVKKIMRISYGVRSADGKRFIKTPELWTEFTQTAAYDAFLFSLFENPEKANNFMTGILPAQLREQAAEAMKTGTDVTELPTTAPTLEGENIKPKNPQEMSHEELLRAFQEKNQS